MKLVSVLGDSISTFENCVPQGYKVFYEGERKKINGLKSVDDMWWSGVLKEMKAKLCVNNSYSGSRVSGMGFPAANSLVRIENLRTAENIPDVILAYIGFNDFGYGVRIERRGLEDDFFSFEYTYDIMLKRMKEMYPDTVIVCGTIMKSRLKENDEWLFPKKFGGDNLIEYNQIIRNVCKKRNCLLADLAVLDRRYETLDTTHPTADGHRTISQAWIDCLKELNLIQ